MEQLSSQERDELPVNALNASSGKLATLPGGPAQASCFS
jgi:hypothetical protein